MDKEERKIMQSQFMGNMVNYLPALRVAAKITQNQLAKKLGIARSTMVAIESQKRPMQWHMYLAMVLVFMQNEDSKKLIDSFDLFDEEYLKGII